MACCRSLLLCLVILTTLTSSGLTAERVGPADAEKLVRTAIFERLPTMNPAITFRLNELTTDEIWERLGAQIYEVNGESWYAIIGREVVLLAENEVLTSMCVADIDHDGDHELLYTYSYGCGVLRSELAMFSPQKQGSCEPVSSYACIGPRWTLYKRDDANVWVGDEDQLMGRVIMEGEGSQRCLSIEVPESLPASTTQRIGVE
jgi:hypothetical protein